MHVQEMRLANFNGTVQYVKEAQNFGQLPEFYSVNI